MAIDPSNPNHVYVGTKAGVFISKDRGDTFTSAGLRWSNHAWTLVFDPKTSPPTLYYGGVAAFLKLPTRPVVGSYGAKNSMRKPNENPRYSA